MCQEESPNLLQNPEFTGEVSEIGVPEGWRLYGKLDEKRHIGLVEDKTVRGRCVLIQDRHPGEEIGISQQVPAQGGCSYLASVKAKVREEGLSVGSYLQLRFLPSQTFSQCALRPRSPGAFKTVQVGAVAPEDTTEIIVYLYTHRSPTPEILVGEASLLKVEALPPRLLLSSRPEPPKIEKLKELHRETPLVMEGKPCARVIVPSSGLYDEVGEWIVDLVKDVTGTELSLVTDEDVASLIPFPSHCVILGNRSTNRILEALYNQYYTLLDLKYPGKDGFVVRSLHNPFGNGFNAYLLGGSDEKGVEDACERFVSEIKKAFSQGKGNDELRLGWLMEIQLGGGYELSRQAKDMETWEASVGYGSVGYFGWNSVSKQMAAYYMTGDEVHAREFLRLAFPDEAAKKEIAEVDGERIENKDCPLGGPYHYNAHMMILFWDLIEESPVFTDQDRLRVTQGFAQQLHHEGLRSAYKGVDAEVPSHVGSRHGQWAALSLYCLGRYFQKDYDHPIWEVCLQNGQQHFESLHRHAWVSGELDNLFWYNTAIAPILTYMALTGDRVPLENGVLAELLKGQEILISGRTPDWALRQSSLGMLHKAAYFTREGRWLTYRDRTALDVQAFRLGQSFWPDENLEPALPSDLPGKWQVHPIPKPMWHQRSSGIPHEESFMFMSYRTRADEAGDFCLLDGMNGTGRNPYHTSVILELRLDGETVLEGYGNQLQTRVDGLTELGVPMDVALKRRSVLGKTALAVCEVQDMAFASWKRTLLTREGRYALVVDTLLPRVDTDHLQVQIGWETKQGKWRKDPGRLGRLKWIREGASRQAVLHVSGASECEVTGSFVSMDWIGEARKGKPKGFFSVIGFEGERKEEVFCLKRWEVEAFLFLPEPAVLATGGTRGMTGELVLLAEDHLHGLGVLAIQGLLAANAPVEVDWDFSTGMLEVLAERKAKLWVFTEGGPHEGTVLYVPQGKHLFQGLVPPAQALQTWLDPVREAGGDMKESSTQESSTLFVSQGIQNVPPAKTINFTEGVTHMTAAGQGDEGRLYVAEGPRVHVFDPTGEERHCFSTDGPTRLLYWWETPGLLLAGCKDEKVIAFDEKGERRWVFVSEMDPAVFRAAKTYWFKTAKGHEGIHGLHTGVFLYGEEQAFVGSACTIEILDQEGNLLHRFPQFWGPTKNMAVVPGKKDSLNLIAVRYPTDWFNAGVFNNKTMDPSRRGFANFPEGHEHLQAWGTMNHLHLFYEDFDGDGVKELLSETNGAWNRVSIWAADGTPKFDVSLGPGVRSTKRYVRDLAVGDLIQDGGKEIVVVTASKMAVGLTGRCEKLWGSRLPALPTVAWIGSKGKKEDARVFIGCEKGAVCILDAQGNHVATSEVQGTPSCILGFWDAEGRPSVVLGTDQGQVVFLP